MGRGEAGDGRARRPMHAAVYWARPRAVQVGVLDPVADAEHARLLCKRARHDLSDHCILHVEADDAVVPTDRFKLEIENDF